MCLGRYSFSFTDTSPTLRRHFTDTSPTLRQHFADSWSILDRCIGQKLVDTRSMVGRHLVDSQKIAVRYIGREAADSRLIYRSRFLSVCIVFSPLSITLEKKLEQDYWNINRLPPLTHGGSWKIRIFGHFSVSYESKLLKIKHESMPFFAIASRFVTFFGTGMYLQFIFFKLVFP